MPGIAHTVWAMLDALGYTNVDVLGVARRSCRPATRPPSALGTAARARRDRPGARLGARFPACPAGLGPPPLLAAGLPTGASSAVSTVDRHAATPMPCRTDRHFVRRTALVGPRVPRAVVRHLRLDRPALAAHAAATHPRAGRRRRPDRPAGQRAHPRPSHSQRPPTHRARRRAPVPPRATGRDGRAGHPISGRPMVKAHCHTARNRVVPDVLLRGQHGRPRMPSFSRSNRARVTACG
jgi:hypothetical protein